MRSNGSRGNRRPREDPTSREEFENLVRLADRDCRQAAVPGLDPDGRFVFAYNAALQLATAWLRLHGIRVPSTGRHAQTFRELQDLLPPSARRYAVEFDRARRKRHALMYDQVGMVGDGEAADLLAAAAEFRELLLDEAARRLSQHRPEG